MKRLENNGRTASTTGTHVETPVSVRSSPPLPFPVVSQNLPRPSESPVLSLRGEASATFVRVSDAVLLPSPSGQTARHRRHVNVTPTVSQEALLSCLQRSHQLLPGSNAVSVYLTCLECRHHVKWYNARAAMMMCLCVLVVVATSSFLDRVLHAIPVVDTIPTGSPCVDIFHVEPSHS